MTTLPVANLAVELDERALAFVLALVSAPSAITGLDHERMDRLTAGDLDRGRASLVSQGFVVEADDGVDVDPRLLFLCAVVGTPAATVEAVAGGRSLVFHATSGQIVEVARTAEDRYVLTALTDPAAVTDRVAALAGTAHRGDRAEAARIDRTEFLEHHDTAEAMTGLLEAAGLTAAGTAASQLDQEPGWVVRGELTAVDEAVRRCRVAGLRDPDLIVCAVDPDAVYVSRDPAYAATAIAALTDAIIGPVVPAV